MVQRPKGGLETPSADGLFVFSQHFAILRTLK